MQTAVTHCWLCCREPSQTSSSSSGHSGPCPASETEKLTDYSLCMCSSTQQCLLQKAETMTTSILKQDSNREEVQKNAVCEDKTQREDLGLIIIPSTGLGNNTAQPKLGRYFSSTSQ